MLVKKIKGGGCRCVLIDGKGVRHNTLNETYESDA